MLKDKIQDTRLAEAACTNAGASTDSSVKASIEETVKAAKDNFMRCLQLNKRRAKHVAIQQKDADVSMLLQGEELRDKSEEGIKKFDEVLTELMKARAEYLAEKPAFPEDLVSKAHTALASARSEQTRSAEDNKVREVKRSTKIVDDHLDGDQMLEASNEGILRLQEGMKHFKKAKDRWQAANDVSEATTAGTTTATAIAQSQPRTCSPGYARKTCIARRNKLIIFCATHMTCM